MTASVPVHHVVEGRSDGPAVILSPSLGTTLAMWDPQAGPLGERLRVVRYDHRGHGRSPVPDGPYSIADLGGDLLALIDRLALERVSLLGVSLGGMVAMWAASEAPERVERLAICCSSAHMPPPEAWHERAATVRAEGTTAIRDATLERWFTDGFRAKRADVTGWVGSMLDETPDEGYASCCDALAELDLRERLPAITAPTLVIAAADDPSTPPEHGQQISELIPSARLTVLSQGAHLVNIEHPEAVNSELLGHLTGDLR